MKHITDFTVIKNELQKRGLWDSITTTPLPNAILANPFKLEIFYHQVGPPELLAWGQYDTIEQYDTALTQLNNRPNITKREFRKISS